MAVSSSGISIVPLPSSSMQLIMVLHSLTVKLTPALESTRCISPASMDSSPFWRKEGLYCGWRKMSMILSCFSSSMFWMASMTGPTGPDFSLIDFIALRWKSFIDFCDFLGPISSLICQISLPRLCARSAASNSAMSSLQSPESSNSIISSLQHFGVTSRPALVRTDATSPGSSSSSCDLRYDGLNCGFRKRSATRTCFSRRRWSMDMSKSAASNVSPSSVKVTVFCKEARDCDDFVPLVPNFCADLLRGVA
mmetsp:Transcript_44808/g.112665  ORF Transcript_44808/g.112665 Transcript_44808/m.112665 type:complete len:252 (+) Transcript_44808:1772-2527(+)